jgi:hypothetical protein
MRREPKPSIPPGPVIVGDHNPSADAGYNAQYLYATTPARDDPHDSAEKPVTRDEVMNLRQGTTARATIQAEEPDVNNQQGIALLTVMLMLLILTILGIASITVTSMENRMAGFFRTTEAVVAAADSCEGLAVEHHSADVVPSRSAPGFIHRADGAPYRRPMPPHCTQKFMATICRRRLRQIHRLSTMRMWRAPHRIL